ncbi:MAG: cytochrome c3 family protein [Planctomycetota bacterium]|jgi:hypothetical protein
MRLIAAIATPFLFLFLTFPVATAGEGSPEGGLAADRAVEKQCLECHDNPALMGSRPDGAPRSVHVDTERYRRSIHYEKGYTCLSCHPDATPEFHPREGVTIFACGSCHDHQDELADFQASRHGRALTEAVENAPDCIHCHSNHYTRVKGDGEARVHPDRIRETCGACHPAEAGRTVSGSWWSGGRVSAHGKSDLSESYGTRDCGRCHFGPDAHKTPAPGEEPSCAACHTRAQPSEGSGPVLGAVHLASPSSAGEGLSVVRAAGLALSLAAVLLLAVPVAFWFASRRGRAEAKKPTEGESAE